MSEYYIGSAMTNPYSLQHYGIKGQKWGRRNYQNPDGSYTAAGRLRYGIGQRMARGAQNVGRATVGRYVNYVNREHAENIRLKKQLRTGSPSQKKAAAKALAKKDMRNLKAAGVTIAVKEGIRHRKDIARRVMNSNLATEAGKYWARSKLNPRRNVFDTTATEHVFSNAKRLAGGAAKSIGHVSAKQLTTGNYAVVTHAGKQSISRMLPALRNDLPALRNSSNGRAVLAIGAAATAAVVTGATVYAVNRHNQKKAEASKANKK